MAIEIVSQNDCLVVDSRLIADELGIEHATLLKTIKKYLTEIQEFGSLAFENKKLKRPQGGTYITNWCLLNEKQSQFVISKSRNGLKTESIEKFKALGFDFSMFPYTESKKSEREEFFPQKYLSKTFNGKRSKKRESDYSKNLARTLNGKEEVHTIGGNIDILTNNEIIEVKEVKMWKHALGQVLVYGHYYPSHQKRIHLYGETQESFLEMINSHCAKFNVTVTWEP